MQLLLLVQVVFHINDAAITITPPVSVGLPPGELSLQPLMETLKADNIVLLFAAVLLERRVLLRCRQYWLMTAVAEGITRLLYPFKFQHVYIPVMPYSLVDYLEVSNQPCSGDCCSGAAVHM